MRFCYILKIYDLREHCFEQYQISQTIKKPILIYILPTT